MHCYPMEIGKLKVREVDFEQLENRCRKEILRQEDVDDSQAMKIIEENVFQSIGDFNPDEIEELCQRLFFRLRSKVGPLYHLVRDDQINEIMVNGYQDVYVEKKGKIYRTDICFDSVQELEDVIRGIASGIHREINEMNPVLDARLKDGSRVNAVYRNVAINGPVLTIRKFSKKKLTMKDLVKNGTLSAQCAKFLKQVVTAGYNIFVSGGTSSGKTTFLNALSDFIPQDERVVVIEDSMELQIEGISNLVQMETRNANAAGRGSVNMGMLIKTSLRQRPDRIIVGEVRGSEVSHMLQALNTGHSGLSTGHGNSARGMLRRMESMYLMDGSQVPMDAIRGQIGEAIDIMIHMQRFKDGSRRVTEISELMGYRDGEYRLNPLFIMEFSEDDKVLKATGNSLVNNMKLRML